MTHWVVTGKFTADGSNAWRRADGSWSKTLADAGLLPDEASAKLHVTSTAANERLISDPYVIEVVVKDGTIEALTARERIRATGPTIRIRRPD